MQQFRVVKAKSTKSTKPSLSWGERRARLTDLISIPENIAMVSCTACVDHGVVCFYSREQSVRCAECLRHQRECDGTFSVKEFRKVGEQKKRLAARSRAKRREIARLRKVLIETQAHAQAVIAEAQAAGAHAQAALAEAESEDVGLQEGLAVLEDRSSRMLQREMQALGVMNTLRDG